MNELIKVNYEKENPTVSGRDLHDFLEITERYSNWFDRMTQYGFEENSDYLGCKYFNTQARQELQDHALTISMAKEICMIQRNDKGKQARQYFLKLEEAWNTPEMVMSRALRMAEKTIHQLQIDSDEKDRLLEEQKPQVVFANAVSVSNTSILVGELTKILKQNGVEIGQNRLFEWLRENEYLIRRKGTDYNMPTQYSMERGLFEIKETAISHADGHTTINKTPKITGKGQIYFINKFKDIPA